MTVIVASPAATPVTLPLASTEATAGSLDFQVSFLLVAFAGATVAVSVSLPPTRREVAVFVERYACNRYGRSLDRNLAGGGLRPVLGGDGDGSLAGLHARYLTVGINGGDFRLIRFPRYILVGGVFWKDSSGKGFITTDKKARFALVEFYARNFDLFIANSYLAGGGLRPVLGGDG